MDKTDYLGSMIICNQLINIGIDDYGQCYYFEYAEDGKIKTNGCGTYNPDFLEEICYYFDKKGAYISLYGFKQYWDLMNTSKENILRRYAAGRLTEEDKNEMLKQWEQDIAKPFSLYDFEELEKQVMQ